MDQVHKYFPGQKLLIDLNSDECFIGKFKNVYPNEINVVEVYDVIENKFVQGMQIFYKNEIRTIRPYKLDIKQEVLLNANKENKDKYEKQNHPEVTLEHLIKFDYRVENLTFLGEPGDVYDAALRDMREQESIAVSVETLNNLGRNSRPEYITILTKENLYIVDLRYMARSYRKLAPIFESTKPIKIIHDSRTVADCLKYRLNIHIRSVFDTLVAILETGGSIDTSLDTAVHKYLNVPSQFFTTGGVVNWYTRPIDDYRKTLTARKVLFLQRLYEVLIQKHLLRNFYKNYSEESAHGNLKNSDSDKDAIEVCNKSQKSEENNEISSTDGEIQFD